MSFSSIIRESQDLGAGLFDTNFNTLCESESTPLHIGSLPGYLVGIQKTLQGGKWNDGDVVIHKPWRRPRRETETNRSLLPSHDVCVGVCANVSRAVTRLSPRTPIPPASTRPAPWRCRRGIPVTGPGRTRGPLSTRR